MQLIIPMSGHGSRFVRAGYTSPKPLIVVEGRPIIAHVLDIFPGETNVTFVCNNTHLATTDMRSVLERLAPGATIRGYDTGEAPKGPVPTVQSVYDLIADDEPVMISYCDYGQVWDYEAFKREVVERGVAGAVPSYTGFHPHLLHKNLYGGILADKNNLLLDYREKFSFTDNPQDSYHSVGAYYFKSGALMKQYHDIAAESEETRINGEHYTSIPFYFMKDGGLPIYVPAVTRFMQWGTPEDLEEYEAWSRLVHMREGLEKKRTEIPAGREEFVKIPYAEDTPEFTQCYEYWRAHFCKE